MPYRTDYGLSSIAREHSPTLPLFAIAQVITSPSTAYGIGSTLTVSPANQTPGTDVDDLTLRITDHIYVGDGRVCQVFLVEILDGALPKAQPTIGPERYFIKLFDPKYATSNHDP